MEEIKMKKVNVLFLLLSKRKSSWLVLDIKIYMQNSEIKGEISSSLPTFCNNFLFWFVLVF